MSVSLILCGVKRDEFRLAAADITTEVGWLGINWRLKSKCTLHNVGLLLTREKSLIALYLRTNGCLFIFFKSVVQFYKILS